MRSTAFDDWPEEEHKRRTRIGFGMIRARAVLAEKGVAPPIDERHADFYDPPLTLAETRHAAHLRFAVAVPDVCRFCRAVNE